MKRMKKVWALVLALVMVLALGVTNAAADDTMDVFVRYTGHGAPGTSESSYNLANGVFVLKDGDTVKYTSEPSGEDGLAKFTGVPAGTYTLEQKTPATNYKMAVCKNSGTTDASSIQITVVKEGVAGVCEGIHAVFTSSFGQGYQWPNGNTDNNYVLPDFRSEFDSFVVEIPFTKVVKQGGNAAPGSQKFELEIFGNTGNGAETAVVEYTAAVDTNGARNYDGKIIIKGAKDQVQAYIGGGFLVREKSDNLANWTYGGEVYGVTVTINNDGTSQPTICKAKKDETAQNGYVPQREQVVDKMTFENTYTRNVSFYYNNNTTTTETKGSPKTFDAGIGVYAVSALLSVTGGAWLVGKKHK